MLEKINDVKDIKNINLKEKNILAQEIREYIIEIVAANGGHLASNLGVVELTIALHSIFNSPNDKIVWDVGHQTYVHKILTGRKDKMHSLRQFGGIAGFPKENESIHDAFNTGHSSTSISIALGMARGNKILNKKDKVVAVIGDGALTGGMALEALNDAGASNSDIIVILNDNQMSISKNVGGMTSFLNILRTRKTYRNSNKTIKNLVSKIPRYGKSIIANVRKLKYSIKQLILPNMFFEDIGFKYLGPVDGHDIEKLEIMLSTAKMINGPVLIHVLTKKGKGYNYAENSPDKFHSTSKFDIKSGEKIVNSIKDYSAVFGSKLVELAKNNDKIVAITCAMEDGTGLTEFKSKYSERFFDVGIAEQHGVSLAAGFAKNGLIPVIPIYSSFSQRAYDQIIHDICIPKLPVVICLDRAGIVGNDGETHHGLFDLAYLSTIPNINIMAPKNFKELEDMLEFAINLKLPIVIRYPRGSEDINLQKYNNNEVVYGKIEILESGKDVTIIAIGNMVSRALEVSEKLKKHNIYCNVINVRFLKPIDIEILEYIKTTKKVITIEDGYINGGLASNISLLLHKNNILDISMINIGYDNEYITHGTVAELEKNSKVDTNSIIDKVLEKWGK